MKTSALRRWLVLLGLIARDQTTRFTGGYDCNFPTALKPYKILIHSIEEGIHFRKVELANPSLFVLILKFNKIFKESDIISNS